APDRDGAANLLHHRPLQELPGCFGAAGKNDKKRGAGSTDPRLAQAGAEGPSEKIRRRMTRIVAITGGSGAGKTTIAQALRRRLGSGALIIAEDDYYRCASTIPNFDPATYNFDEPPAKEHALLCAHLKLAKSGAAFDKPLYDLTTHR